MRWRGEKDGLAAYHIGNNNQVLTVCGCLAWLQSDMKVAERATMLM